MPTTTASALPFLAPDPASTNQLRAVQAAADPHDLVSVGIAVHHLTECMQHETQLDLVEAHQATAILTKQISAVLDQDRPLDAVRQLVTDPHRIATSDGRTAATAFGHAWRSIQHVAMGRSQAAIDGALEFGVSAILTLAATRAASSDCVWWGTPGWSRRVQAWSRAAEGTALLEDALMHAPEYVEIDIVTDVLALGPLDHTTD